MWLNALLVGILPKGHLSSHYGGLNPGSLLNHYATLRCSFKKKDGNHSDFSFVEIS